MKWSSAGPGCLGVAPGALATVFPPATGAVRPLPYLRLSIREGDLKPSVLLDYSAAVERDGFVVRALLKLEGQAPESGRAPLNISLVLDRSGSMDGEKLHFAREAAAMLVRRLSPEDIVSVVTYDDEVDTVAPPARGDAQRDLPATLGRIESGGSTNLSGGWLKGREHLRQGRPLDERVKTNRLVLLTDGLANVGITEPDKLIGLCRKALEQGVTTTTIGFGADYDERLLRAMADAGGGNTFYIETPDQAPGVFEEEIEGLLSLSAQNITIEVRPTDDVELVRVVHDVPARPIDGGFALDIGDLYAREPRAVLIEFFVPGINDAAPREIARVVTRADVLTADGGIERQEITLPIASALSPDGHSEPEVQREVLLLDVARAREEALRRRDQGDAGGAEVMLREVAFSIRSSGIDAPQIAEQAEDLVAMADLMRDQSFTVAEEKYMSQRAYNVHRSKRAYEEKLRRKR
jgi:Ca-activated chloride channel homolog